MSISGKDIKRVSVARGAVLVVGMRWMDRLVGLVSTLILARLLLPEDFGIVAMASVVVGLIDTLLDLGVGSALVQHREAGREEFDTAWTVRLIQCAFVALLIFFSAPYAATYFHDPRVEAVVQLMAVTTLLGGLENIGIVAFQKNMEFGRDFQFFFYRRIVGFLVTVTFALLLHSYWAMVFGALAGRLAGVVLSYVLHDFRPRLSLVRLGRIWSFSQWILVSNMGGYALKQLDKFVIGGRESASVVGAYSLADDIAAMPSTELLAPLNRVLFPVFVDAAHDGEKLRAAYGKALGVQTLVALPAGVGLCMIAGTVVPFLLGPNWDAAIPLIRILALMSISAALSYSSGYLLITLGKVHALAIESWARLGVLAVLLFLVFPHAGAEGVALVRLAATALGFLFFTGLVLYYVEAIRFADIVSNTWRACAATALMALALEFVPRPESLPLALQVLWLVAVGVVVYGAGVLCLWRLSGCANGAESYVLGMLRLERFFRWGMCAK